MKKINIKINIKMKKKILKIAEVFSFLLIALWKFYLWSALQLLTIFLAYSFLVTSRVN